MFKSILVVMIIIFAGCTINLPASKPEQSNDKEKVVTQVEKKTHEPWPKGEKEYWYARYFFNMAVNPQIQMRLQPRDVY